MHIVHVEDDRDIREIAKMALELAGDLQVTQFDCGEAAVGAAADVSPDLLLLDVMMPGMTGPETLAKLREFDHLKETPAIYMTARVQANEVDTFRNTGALGVIAKPFDPVTLGDQIRKMMAG